jgi:hypothetical protein
MTALSHSLTFLGLFFASCSYYFCSFSSPDILKRFLSTPNSLGWKRHSLGPNQSTDSFAAVGSLCILSQTMVTLPFAQSELISGLHRPTPGRIYTVWLSQLVTRSFRAYTSLHLSEFTPCGSLSFPPAHFGLTPAYNWPNLHRVALSACHPPISGLHQLTPGRIYTVWPSQLVTHFC